MISIQGEKCTKENCGISGLELLCYDFILEGLKQSGPEGPEREIRNSIGMEEPNCKSQTIEED